MEGNPSGRLPHIVVLGAGFGGLTFCQRFPAGLAEITLIDRQNQQLLQARRPVGAVDDPGVQYEQAVNGEPESAGLCSVDEFRLN